MDKLVWIHDHSLHFTIALKNKMRYPTTQAPQFASNLHNLIVATIHRVFRSSSTSTTASTTLSAFLRDLRHFYGASRCIYNKSARAALMRISKVDSA